MLVNSCPLILFEIIERPNGSFYGNQWCDGQLLYCTGDLPNAGQVIEQARIDGRVYDRYEVKYY